MDLKMPFLVIKAMLMVKISGPPPTPNAMTEQESGF